MYFWELKSIFENQKAFSRTKKHFRELKSTFENNYALSQTAQGKAFSGTNMHFSGTKKALSKTKKYLNRFREIVSEIIIFLKCFQNQF